MQGVNYAEVYYREYCDILTKNFRSNLEKELYVDLIFVCKYNKRVVAHQLVLGSFSSLLNELFKEHQLHFKGHVAYVCVPDIRARSMSHILKFIYYGRVALRNKEELCSLYQDLELLGLPSHVMTSKSELFHSVISGIENSKNIQKPDDGKSCSVMVIAETSNKVPKSPINTTNVNTDDVNEIQTPLPIISSVSSMVSNVSTNQTAENMIENSAVILKNAAERINPSEELLEDIQQNIHSCESVSKNNESGDNLNNSSNDETTSKTETNLMSVLKNVVIACQNLEAVGVSDDDNVRRHLKSCIRIVKHCIVDINELLSTDVRGLSNKNYKYDIEKDWELRIVLDNCLEKLPRLERTINRKDMFSKRRERAQSIQLNDQRRN